MFWIQEVATNKNNVGYKLFYAETLHDIDLMPTNVKKGIQENGDTVANHICSLGSECLCLENGVRFILSNSGWKKVANQVISGSTGGNTTGGGGCNCEGITIIQNDDTEPIPNREILSLFNDASGGDSGSGSTGSDTGSTTDKLDIESIPHEKIEELFK
ncbi:hypothetical protein [Roseburia sp. 1XD42-69]|uniref:hypothetical protein n=1 Tax=Roseburia sp. 1XD42-69 TaxID=2320088 RepID=UPI000EA0DD54|nr:hypothetical protein [Roseburia sp. 1XD42-69]RKJ61160.1 hypothetical protein D7Y06_21395 [Roseburia sp. 1XD42-69]